MRRITAALLATAACPIPAAAQDAGALRAQIEAMQAQIERLSAQVAQLEAQQKAAVAAPVDVAAAPPKPAPAPASSAPAAPLAVAWNGAPQLTGADGFSFKPRGRLQMDTAVVAAPASLVGVGKVLAGPPNCAGRSSARKEHCPADLAIVLKSTSPTQASRSSICT